MAADVADTAHIFDPGENHSPGNFPAGRIENEGVDVLRALQFFQIFAGSPFASALVRAYCFCDYTGSQALNPRFTGRTQSNHHQNRQHQKQRLRRPERQKDLQEKAFHFRVLAPGRANMYPTPRIVLMWSPLSSESPSFRRTLLTCISMLRSNGMNFRLSTAFTNRSRVTTRPASRNSTSSRLNSTEVNSTG